MTESALTAALVQIVADRGLDAVSVRQVAAAAGVTGGTVQHHFPTKQAMLIAALNSVTATFQARAAAACAGRGPTEALRELAHQLLPLDAERAAESRVWLAFLARAAVDPQLARVHRAGWQELEDVLTGLLAAVRERTEPADADRADAGLLLATLDGLATAGAVEPGRLPPARIAALVDAQLATLTRDPAVTTTQIS